VKVTTQQFREEARKALGDEILQRALAKAKPGFINKRKKAVDALPEFDALRADARAITEHTLAHLDYYLERFEANVVANGGVVHWARTADEANQIILGICEAAGAHSVIKGKSMIAEEMALNESLEGAGLEVVETDLGEYIIQLAEEHPSHIIAPAVHKTREQITELFYKHHRQYGKTERQTEPRRLSMRRGLY
jgi:L-lactate dehydrogenase complex protein LldF